MDGRTDGRTRLKSRRADIRDAEEKILSLQDKKSRRADIRDTEEKKTLSLQDKKSRIGGRHQRVKMGERRQRRMNLTRKREKEKNSNMKIKD